MTDRFETDVLTVPQAARYLQVSLSTMQRLIATRRVTSLKINRSRRVTKRALAQYVNNLEREARLSD